MKAGLEPFGGWGWIVLVNLDLVVDGKRLWYVSGFDAEFSVKLRSETSEVGKTLKRGGMLGSVGVSET